MKRVLKNILKWLVCVCLTFTVFFTISQAYEIVEGIYVQVNREKIVDNFMNSTTYEEGVKYYQELTDEEFLGQPINEREKFIKDLYENYPAGSIRFVIMMSYMASYGNLAITSLTLGLIIGTAIFMLMDKDKRGLKIAIILYIISYVVLGFIQGFQNISTYNGATLTLLERWMFPDEYIVPVSIAFALVIAVRYIRQKDIANKLNEKLKQIKEEKNK